MGAEKEKEMEMTEENRMEPKTGPPRRNLNVDGQQSHKPLKIPKRGIKRKGGYAPPPKYTEEQRMALYVQQENSIAQAGLKFLNKRKANGDHYELVMAHDSRFFRTNEGWRFHSNFVAKIADNPNAENRLFFAFLMYDPLDYDTAGPNTCSQYKAINCLDLGLIDTDFERCQSCEICKKMNVTCPKFHPVDSQSSHTCDLCEQERSAYPIFHPPGLKVDHLLYVCET